jgi:hypothetical protein
VTDAKEGAIELRALASARSAGDAFDLRCEIREKLIGFLQREHPTALPRGRWEAADSDSQRSYDERRARTAAR